MAEVGSRMADLWRGAGALAGREPWLVGGAVALLSISGFVADNLGRGGTMASAVAQLAVQWGLLRHVAVREQWVAEGGRTGGIVALFGQQFLTTLGMMLGLVLLVVPGLYVAARWSAASAIVIAEDLRVTDAIGESWRRTKGWALPVAILLCLLFAPFVLLIGGIIALSDVDASETMVELAMTNVAIALATVAAWYVGLALYGRTRAPQEALEEVFA